MDAPITIETLTERDVAKTHRPLPAAAELDLDFVREGAS